MLQNGVYRAFFQRLPQYLNYLYAIDHEEVKYISSTTIAKGLNLGEVQVRKDLQLVAKNGKPKIGYETKELIERLEKYLGYDKIIDVIIVGCGKLGQALLAYKGFIDRGINICAGFDINETKIGMHEDKEVYNMDNLKAYCEENNIKVAIVAVPKENAQAITDLLIECGINKIWNFSPIRLSVPENIVIQNEDLASELAIFAKNIN
jgi:redox-sensing transcriptional repressor